LVSAIATAGDAPSDVLPGDANVGQQIIVEMAQPGNGTPGALPFGYSAFEIVQHFDFPFLQGKALPCRGEAVFKQALREAFGRNAAPVSRWCLPSFDRSQIAPCIFFALQPRLQPAFQY